MPFYNNVYYPYAFDAQGTHSSAGIPSLLNSPQSHPSSGSQGGPGSASAMSGQTTFSSLPPVPFRFSSRRESVDWRRIGAVDVERVASELDFGTLQEHVGAVAFSFVEAERCQRCQASVDPALLKLFRLAQLTVEYLLHSQDCLALSLQAAEEHARARAQENEELQAQLQKQSQEVKVLKEELKQRKKIITSQQAMISAGMTSYHKCQHCDKAFMNSSFLQSHMQRRHLEDYDIKQMTDNQKKVQSMKLQEELNKLKEQLSLTRSQLETQQQAYQAKESQEKVLGQKQEEFMKQLEVWKEDERLRMSRQMEDVRETCHRETDAVYKRNLNLEKQLAKVQDDNCKLQEQMQVMQGCKEKTCDTQQQQEAVALQQKLQKQEERWAARMQKIKEEHESEKNQLHNDLTQLRSSYSLEKRETRRQVEDLGLQLQEQREIIASQNKQMKQITSNPPVVVLQREALVSTPPEPKPQLVVNEQHSMVHTLDPIVELSEEEKDSSSISEKPPKRRHQEVEELLRNPGLRKEIRQTTQQVLQERLLSLGVQTGTSGLAKGTYESLVAKLASERKSKAKEDPDYQRTQRDLRLRVEQRVRERTREQPSKPKLATQVLQARPRSSSLPTKVVSRPVHSQPHTPQPAPRSKTTLPKTSTPKSDEDSSEEEEDDEEESVEEPPRRQRTSQSKAPQAISNVTNKAQPARVQPVARAAVTAADRHAGAAPQASVRRPGAPQAVTQTASAPPTGRPTSAPLDTTQPLAAPAFPVGQTTVMALESESEWTEGSEMEEIDPAHLRKYKDLNGNVKNDIRGNAVKDLAKSLEKQLLERSPVKPTGGVNTVPERIDVVKKLKYSGVDVADDEEEEEDDDWDISSLEDIPAVPKPSQSPPPVRRSLDKSLDTSTSVWGTSTGKGQKQGLTEAGTGSTLKSSLVSVSDWSDTDDI